MRVPREEPTGVWVRGADGEAAALTFPAFVAAVEDGAVLPDDLVWSRIVTGAQWVRAGKMRLFHMLTEERRLTQEKAAQVWPPPPRH